ncbi:MAG: NfeD family protein [Verrucomicrobiota bacterium]|nr:NfeD family protein [Verrucomicrobiota bacterium]
MKHVVLGVSALLGVIAVGFAQANPPVVDRPVEAGLEESFEGKVVEIEVGGKSLMDLRKFEVWTNTLGRVEKEKARAVVFRIDALEGYLPETEKLMGQVANLSVPSYALIEGKALGAGALLALATQTIYMTPESLIGGAGLLAGEDGGDETERQQRDSLMLAKIRTVAGKQGHAMALIQAMLEASEQQRRFGDLVVPKGTILTLTAQEAVSQVEGKALLAAGQVRDVAELLGEAGLSGAAVVKGARQSTAAVKRPAPAERAEASWEETVEEKSQNDLPGKLKEETFEGKLVVLKVGREDLINKQSFRFWRRMLRRAEDEKARAVLFDLDTPGGYAYETKEIMSEITRLKIPCYAFVNENALSAGALMSVATDGIYMSPEGTIGAAGIVSGSGAEIGDMMRKKLHSAFEAQIRSVAEKKGYDPELIRAMMIPEDRDRVFGAVVVRAGELLTLTASEATSLRDGKTLLAKAVAGSIEEIAELEGMEGVSIVRAEATAFENFAWWVSKWSFLLILVGMAAAYAELKAPGFGVGGAISLLAFGMFFFGNYMAGNLANYELVALFFLGVILVAVELFLIPGTGVAGILGVLCMLGALLLGTVDKIDWNDWKFGEFSGNLLDLLRGPALTLGAGLLGGCTLVLLLMRFLPDTPIFRAFIAKQELAGGASLEDEAAVVGSGKRVDWTGEALTDLRPSGKAVLSGEEFDVVADGAFIRKGAKVRVLEQDGMRIVVGEIDSA